MLNTDNFTAFDSYQFSRFKSFPKYEKKARVLKVFSAAEIFFSKTMLGLPNRPIRDIFGFSCFPLILAHIFLLQFQPISEGRKIQRKKKQFREFLTALKGTLCTRLIYLRLKSTDFWATYDGGRKFIIMFFRTAVAGSFTSILLLRTCYSPWRRSFEDSMSQWNHCFPGLSL